MIDNAIRELRKLGQNKLATQLEALDRDAAQVFVDVAGELRSIGRDALAVRVEQSAAAVEASHSAEVLELTAQVQVQTIAYNDACVLVAKMHEAAVGEVRGPDVGPVEDIAALKADRDSLYARVEDLVKQLVGLANPAPVLPPLSPRAAELAQPAPDITAPSPAPAVSAPAPAPQVPHEAEGSAGIASSGDATPPAPAAGPEVTP